MFNARNSATKAARTVNIHLLADVESRIAASSRQWNCFTEINGVSATIIESIRKDDALHQLARYSDSIKL